jgi:hypothetical protein
MNAAKTDPRAEPLLRPYRVHAREAGRHSAVVIEETSAAAAAVAYAETCPDAFGAEVSLMVRDLVDGQEHCICVDLDTGDLADCAGS